MVKSDFEEYELNCNHYQSLYKKGRIEACARIVEHSILSCQYFVLCSESRSQSNF
jgi:hypothetical protein